MEVIPDEPYIKSALAFVNSSKFLHMKSLLGYFSKANLFLWTDKKASAAVFAAATAIWVLFELMEYHLLTLVCHFLMLTLAILFLWSYVTRFMNKSPPNILQVRIPEDLAVNFANSLRVKINLLLDALEEIALGHDLKKVLAVIAGLWVVSMIGSCCSFFTMFYLALVLVHAVPLVYEKYENEIDSFGEKAMEEIKKQIVEFGDKFLSKIPRDPLKDKNN
ncbi:hypothetical protein IEQ34_021842 [Dendrobium chrysotoxum]|uniref:Reticulon-like protein n=1 Tax=Dendrobium chrysotoxum TaxID=161865 RepID=A0AAV7FXC2_DENCH|nr:hypothetical protein IEQ34_021842 [Dendrobium chrysotoxum]